MVETTSQRTCVLKAGRSPAVREPFTAALWALERDTQRMFQQEFSRVRALDVQPET